jgi:hypothetical protein
MKKIESDPSYPAFKVTPVYGNSFCYILKPLMQVIFGDISTEPNRSCKLKFINDWLPAYNKAWENFQTSQTMVRLIFESTEVIYFQSGKQFCLKSGTHAHIMLQMWFYR